MSGGGNRVTLSSLASIDEDSDQQVQQRLNLILKADASGSCEAVKSALSALPQDAVLLRYLMAAPGEITTSDLELAAASGGMVLGFNVQVPDAVQVRCWRWRWCGVAWWLGVGWGGCRGGTAVQQCSRRHGAWTGAPPCLATRPHPPSPAPPPPRSLRPSLAAWSCAPTASSITWWTTCGRPWRAASSLVRAMGP